MSESAIRVTIEIAGEPAQELCLAPGMIANIGGLVWIRRSGEPEPANIMAGEFGEVLLMDWRLAKIIGQEEPDVAMEANPAAEAVAPSPFSDVLEFGAGLTIAGALMGTPQYMAPEQAEGRLKDIDARTDIWAAAGSSIRF